MEEIDDDHMKKVLSAPGEGETLLHPSGGPGSSLEAFHLDGHHCRYNTYHCIESSMFLFFQRKYNEEFLKDDL